MGRPCWHGCAGLPGTGAAPGCTWIPACSAPTPTVSTSALLLVFGALPPAVLNYVFAERYRCEPDKVASIVMIGNLFALLFIPLALGYVLD